MYLESVQLLWEPRRDGSCFSPVNLSYVSLTVRLAKESRRARKDFSPQQNPQLCPQHLHFVLTSRRRKILPACPREAWCGVERTWGRRGVPGPVPKRGSPRVCSPAWTEGLLPLVPESPGCEGDRSLQLRPAPVSSVPCALEIRPFGSRPCQASPRWGRPSESLWPEPSQCWLPLQLAPTAPCPTPSAFQV